MLHASDVLTESIDHHRFIRHRSSHHKFHIEPAKVKMMRSVWFLVLSVAAPSLMAFTPTIRSRIRHVNLMSQLYGSGIHSDTQDTHVSSFDPLNLASSSPPPISRRHPAELITAASIASLAMACTPSQAMAAEPDWGLFEGRIASMLHPIAMGGLLLLSLSTGIKGLQYRRQRTLGDEISQLKKSVPDLRGAATVREALQNAEKQEKVDSVYVQALKVAIPTQEQIDLLIQERKDLAAQNVRDNHFSSGALLAFLGTAFAIEGPLNTVCD